MRAGRMEPVKVAEPVVLAFHMTQERAEQLSELLAPLNLKVKQIPDSQSRAPLGLLAGAGAPAGGISIAGAGTKGMSLPGGMTKPMPAEPELSEEMIVMCGIDSKGLDGILKQMREKQVRVSLKAMLTPINRNWSAGYLQCELKREREALRK